MLPRLFNIVIACILLAPLVLYLFFPNFSLELGIMELKASRLLSIFTFVMIYIVASVGLNVQTGFAGQLNLGYAGFMAIGAYSAAIWQVNNPDFVQQHEFLTVLVSLFLSFVFSSLVGLLICLPTLRLRGDYFAIVTFGFAEIVRQVIKNEEALTGGSNGIPNLIFMPESAEKMRLLIDSYLGQDISEHFDSHTYIKYLFFIILVALVVVLVTKLRDSQFGRSFFALRENPTAAQSCGISLTNAKIGAFLISAGLGGVAGYMMIIYSAIASPDDYQFMISVFVVCCIVLGGLGSVGGSVLGALVLMSLGEFIRDILEALPRGDDGMPLVPNEARIIFFGLVLVLMMRLRPNGLITLERDTRRLADQEDLEQIKLDSIESPYYKVGDKK